MANDQLLQRLLLEILSGQVQGEGAQGAGAGGRMVGGFPPGPPDAGGLMPLPTGTPPTLPSDVQGGIPGGQLSFPPGSLTEQLNRIGAEGDALTAAAPSDPSMILPQQAPPIGDVAPRTPSPFSVQGGFYPSEAPLDPTMQLPIQAPQQIQRAPDSRSEVPPFDEQGGYSGGRLRFPEQAEPAPGQLPAAPEKEGDLSRGRASRKLEELLAMQSMAEGLGNMEVVTTGDILHRTAKGMGTKPRFKAEGLRSMIEMEAEREDMVYKHGLDLEAIKARGEAATKTALATRTPPRLSPTERAEWRGAQVAVGELNDILATKIDKGYNTGPIANAFEDLAAFVGFEAFGFAEKQEFKYKAARIVREYIFSLSGKQTSGQERKDLMKLVPRGRDDDILFENKIRGFQAFIKRKQNVLLESQPESTAETEQLRRMMVEEDRNDPYLHRGGKTVYQVEDPDAPGAFFDVSEATWKKIMANPGGTRYKAVPLKSP